MGKILRRTFLIGSAAVAGGVAFGYWKIKTPYPNPLKGDLDKDQAALTPYVLIDQSGVSIIAPRAEMGQGVMTTLAALVAEELDIGLDAVTVLHGPASKAYYNAAIFEEAANKPATDDSANTERMRQFMHIPAKLLGMQLTGGSSSMPDAYTKMRKAGAAARIVLLKAAAKKLKVDVATLTTDNGHVVAADGTRVPYTELAVLARAINPPDNPDLKPKSDWKLLGKSQPRVDMLGKCTGTAQFGIDIRLPGMLYAAVRMNPHRGAALKSFDARNAEDMPGVKRIFSLDNGVAVIASNTWNAFRAADAVICDWEKAPYPASNAELTAALANAFTDDLVDGVARKDGDVALALLDSDFIEGSYQVPYLAHATMEPMNATALFKDGQLDVWAGNQIPTQAVKDAISLTGLDEKNIRIHTTLMGGGFGRRGEMDFIKQAIQIAMAMKGTPVKLTWPREEDMTQDYYRPAAMARFKATHANGKPTAIDLHLAASSVVDSQFGRLGLSLPGPDATISQAAWDQPYNVPNYRVTAYKAPMALPVSSWRAVGASQNGFFHESMIDEIADAAGVDPLQMRLDMMTHEPSRKVLETVRDMSGWGQSLPETRARGVAFVLSFGVPSAQVIEIEQTPRGIKLVKIYAAVDVGTALDPANIEAQVQSAVIYGLSAAIQGEITVADGKVEQTNFHDYDALRMFQSPPIDVAILEHGTHIRGIGEPGLPPTAPALANAVFSLTKNRIRTLPLGKAIAFI